MSVLNLASGPNLQKREPGQEAYTWDAENPLLFVHLLGSTEQHN